MRKIHLTLTLILTLGSVVFICQAENGGTIKCDASAREFGETGDVQCMYPTDLNSLTGIAFVNILHFEPNSTYDVPILDCLWDEIRYCNNLKPGFKVTEITGKSLKVTISKVTKGHFGKYVCEIWHESLVFSAEPCIFQIKGATSPGLQSNSPVVDKDPESGEVIDAVPPPNGIHSSGKEEEGDMYGTGNGATSPGLQSNSPVVDEDPEPGEVIYSGECVSGGAVAGLSISVLINGVLIAVIGVLC
ncbi:hypothetical protein ACOMHN_013271 [Nucella lapillus]